MNEIRRGNCLELMKKMDENSVDLIFTSPPYNMRTRVRKGEYTTREKSEHFSKKYEHFDDALSIKEYEDFHTDVLKECLRLSKITLWNIQIVTGSKEAIFKIIGKFATSIKDIIIWDKGHGQPAMHEGCINRATELIIIFEQNASAGRTLKTYNFERGMLEDIWRIKRGKSIKGHGACFSIDLAKKAILNFTKEGDTVLDPFTGSGTTNVACKETNRNCIGIELSKEYCEIATKRLEQSNIKSFFEES
jgi:site-specific DNA-methyltransferase (adenine-specific)/modification methylase